MSKKPSKAKRSRSKPLRIPRDPVTGQQFIFDPATGEPTRRFPGRAPSAAEVEAARAARRARQERDAIRRAAFHEKRERHDSMKGHFGLPNDVRQFLDRLYREPILWPHDESQIPRERVIELLQEVYFQGCAQGYIEGRVQGMERDRLVSKKRNQRKREKNKLDERNAEIVAEYAVLRPMVGATEAQLRLAEKYALTDKMIRIIIGKARKADR